MSPQDRQEIRGITLPLIKWLIGCTVAVCLTGISSAVYIKSTFNLHEYRIGQLEATSKDHTDKIEQLIAHRIK